MSDESETQVLLTGCYRTGSTYITNLLGNAPEFATEMHLTNFMRNCYGEYDPIGEEENYVSLVLDTAGLVRLRSGRTLAVHQVIDYCERLEGVTYGALYDAIMRDLITEDVPKWGEKIQLVWRQIPDFLEMFENGKALLIVRDPRSILASFKRFTYAPEPRYLGAIFNTLDAMQKGQEYVHGLPDDRIRIVAYEDVMREPIETVKSILTFLGLSTEHDLLSEEGWTDESGDPWNANSEFDDGTDFDADAAINRWKGNLEEWEVALCERVTGEMMREYGYKLSDVSVPESEYLETLRSDPQIRHFFEKWQRDGNGVQQYPADPTEPENWAENR